MKYDKTNPASIEAYGKRLIDKTLATVLGEREIPVNELKKLISGRTRGDFGNIIETCYFGINPGSESVPDFQEAGIELKTTPIKKLKNGLYSAKERLVLGMIDYVEESKKTFWTSHLMFKNSRLMIVSYLHREGETIGNTKIKLAKLYDFENLPEEDKRIIRDDWNIINKKLKDGKAHELSEGDTLYLGACTKSATAKNRRTQIGGIPAKPRAYSYKSGYMTQLVRRELGVIDKEEERVIKGEEVDTKQTFENQVLSKFKPFLGKTSSEIEEAIGCSLNSESKQYYATLSNCMMGVEKGKILEFEAANVRMKTIRIKNDGTPKEGVSFPSFKYEELVKEVWDADEEEGEVPAKFQEYLETRFLFVIFECEKKCEAQESKRLKKVFFWSMSYEDRMKARKVWDKTIQTINLGKVVKSISYDKNGDKKRHTYFPSSTENDVSHVRPHGKDSSDTYPLPTPDIFTGADEYTKHCFWFNQEYLKKVIKSNE